MLEPDSVITIGRTRIVFRVLAQASGAPRPSAPTRDPAPRHGRILGARRMSELTLLVLRLGFLAAALGVRLRDRLRAALRPVRPARAQAAAGCRGRAAAPAAASPWPPRRRSPQPRRRRPDRGRAASGRAGIRRRPRDRLAPQNATRLVITSGAEGGRRVPARPRRDHHRPLQRLGARHPRRLHLHPPRPPHAVERPSG